MAAEVKQIQEHRILLYIYPIALRACSATVLADMPGNGEKSSPEGWKIHEKLSPGGPWSQKWPRGGQKMSFGAKGERTYHYFGDHFGAGSLLFRISF